MYLRHQAYTLYYHHVCILVFMYLCFPCYCDACLNSSNLRVGLKTLLNTTIEHSRLQHVVQVHGSSGTLGCANVLIGLYRIKLRSKKYYQRIFFHFVDTVVVNSWLLCQNVCNGVGLQESKQLCLQIIYFSCFS